MAERKYLIDINLDQNELRNAVVHRTGTAPAGPTSGQIYYDTDDDKLYYWNGGTWVDTTSARGASFSLIANSPLVATQSGATYSIDINQATQVSDGSMPASDKLKLDSSTSSNIAETLILRDPTGSFNTTMISGLTGPTLASDVTNKDYVDTAISNSQIAIDAQTPLVATQSGNTYSIDINQATQVTDGSMPASDKLKIDSATSSNTNNTLVIRDSNGSFNTTMISGLTAPTLDSDAANKGYVDSLAQGLDIKESCRVLSDTNITLSGTQTIDGVSVTIGDRVLVAGQGGDTSTPDAANGIYVVDSGSWSRPEDANADSEVTAGMFTFVTEGTTYSDTGWVMVTNDDIIVDTTPINFIQFSQAGVLTGGDGINKVGNTLNIDLATNSGLTFSSSQLTVSSTIAGDGTTWTSGTIDVVGGTGIQVNADDIEVDGTSLAGTGITWNGSQFEAVNDGDITGVTAGSGLTGGGTQGAVTLDVNTDNGLSISFDNVVLGGTLSQNTNIDGVSTHNFTLTNINDYSIGAASYDLSSGSTVSIFGNLATNITTDGTLNVEFDASTITDNSGDGFGLQYSTDYSGTFITNSLITKKYVDDQVGAIDADITGVTAGDGLSGGGTQGFVTLDVNTDNGLSIVSDNVVLGGTLSQDTNLDLNGFTFSFSGGPIEYSTDVSTSYNNRSLVDKEYVDTEVGNSITSITAGNGLVGGGTQGAVTLDINPGAGLTVSSSTVSALVDNATIQTNLNGELQVIPGTYPTKYEEASVSIGSGPGPQTITHNLNTTYVNVSVFDSTTGEEYVVDVEHTNANNVTIDANGAPKTVNVVVVG